MEQVETLATVVGIIWTQLVAPPDGAAYLNTCFELGLLHESHHRSRDNAGISVEQEGAELGLRRPHGSLIHLSTLPN